jgi:hypothetical protein
MRSEGNGSASLGQKAGGALRLRSIPMNRDLRIVSLEGKGGQRSEVGSGRSEVGGRVKKLEAWRRMGRAVKEDERPTSNIQRPTSNEKTDWQAGKRGAWRRMGRAEKGMMGFALPTFLCLPGNSKLTMKAIPIEQKAPQPILHPYLSLTTRHLSLVF